MIKHEIEFSFQNVNNNDWLSKNMKLCFMQMEQESIMNSVGNSTGQIWSSKSKRFAKLVNNVKQLKSDDNSFLLLLNKQTKRIFLFLAKHIA